MIQEGVVREKSGRAGGREEVGVGETGGVWCQEVEVEVLSGLRETEEEAVEIEMEDERLEVKGKYLKKERWRRKRKSVKEQKEKLVRKKRTIRLIIQYYFLSRCPVFVLYPAWVLVKARAQIMFLFIINVMDRTCNRYKSQENRTLVYNTGNILKYRLKVITNNIISLF